MTTTDEVKEDEAGRVGSKSAAHTDTHTTHTRRERRERVEAQASPSRAACGAHGGAHGGERPVTSANHEDEFSTQAAGAFAGRAKGS